MFSFIRLRWLQSIYLELLVIPKTSHEKMLIMLVTSLLHLHTK